MTAENKQITRIGVLASGGGSNMQAIMDRITASEIRGQIVVVISDVADAFALERAQRAGIETAVMRPRDFASRAEYSAALAGRLQAANVDLVVMAGFMRILTPDFFAAFNGRVMNIHPALIPSFCGPGFYGHHVHEAVLNYGVKVSGCTVHFADAEVDGGPIIVQRVVPVQEDDTPDTLAARILVEEHKAYPEAVKLFCEGRLVIDGRLVRVLPEVVSAG